MRRMRGFMLFVGGIVTGIFIMLPGAAPQEKVTGLRLNHIGIIVKDSSVVKSLTSTFEEDWLASGFDEARDAVKINAGVVPENTAKANRALAKEMSPLKMTLKKAIKQAVNRAGKEAVANGDLKSTVKSVVKTAMKEAVKEMTLIKEGKLKGRNAEDLINEL